MLSNAPLSLGEASLPDASPGDRDRAGSGPAELPPSREPRAQIDASLPGCDLPGDLAAVARIPDRAGVCIY